MQIFDHEVNWKHGSKTDEVAVADLGGVPGAHPPPMGPNSFIFACIFTKKHLHRGSIPPMDPHPLLREILDPPLGSVSCHHVVF